MERAAVVRVFRFDDEGRIGPLRGQRRCWRRRQASSPTNDRSDAFLWRHVLQSPLPPSPSSSIRRRSPCARSPGGGFRDRVFRRETKRAARRKGSQCAPFAPPSYLSPIGGLAPSPKPPSPVLEGPLGGFSSRTR